LKTDQQQPDEVENAKLQFKFEPDKALFSCQRYKKTAGVSQSFNLGLRLQLFGLNLNFELKDEM